MPTTANFPAKSVLGYICNVKMRVAVPTMLTIVGSRDQFCTPRNFVPEGHFLVGDVPQPDFSIKRARDEKLVILGVESKGGDAVDVLENTETVFN